MCKRYAMPVFLVLLAALAAASCRPLMAAEPAPQLLVESQAAHAQSVVYVASVFFDGRIESVSADGSVRQVVREVGPGLRGIALDINTNSLFWTDVHADRIERIDLNAPSGVPSAVISTGLAFPQDLDLSGSIGKLFWADAGLGDVETSNLDGSARSLLFSASTTAIGVDDVNGRIYSENRSTSERGSIVRSNPDGTGFEVVISNVPTAADIAIDPVREVIYWTSSAGLVGGNGGVYRVDFDGSDFAEIFVMGSNLDTSGIALDLPSGKVYFGQESSANGWDLYRINLDGSNPEVVATGFGIITHLALVPDHSTSVTIDIKPGDETNSINPRSDRKLWVAVLSDTAFDPLQIEVGTVRFGPDGATAKRNQVRDVNMDGRGDLLLQFEIAATAIQCGDADATLTGATLAGQRVTATDAIKTVGCRRRH